MLCLKMETLHATPRAAIAIHSIPISVELSIGEKLDTALTRLTTLAENGIAITIKPYISPTTAIAIGGIIFSLGAALAAMNKNKTALIVCTATACVLFAYLALHNHYLT